MPKTQQEVIQQGYQALISHLGIVDAIRFIQHFTPEQGDYTSDRYQWLDQYPLENILTAMREMKVSDTNQYEEIIE
jgi:hypothetical protein